MHTLKPAHAHMHAVHAHARMSRTYMQAVGCGLGMCVVWAIGELAEHLPARADQATVGPDQVSGIEFFKEWLGVIASRR